VLSGRWQARRRGLRSCSSECWGSGLRQAGVRSSRKVGHPAGAHRFSLDNDPEEPVSTSRWGVFVAGAFREVVDIPEAVTSASAATAKVMALLRDAGRRPGRPAGHVEHSDRRIGEHRGSGFSFVGVGLILPGLFR
jgi:hypothetical protein